MNKPDLFIQKLIYITQIAQYIVYCFFALIQFCCLVQCNKNVIYICMQFVCFLYCLFVCLPSSLNRPKLPSFPIIFFLINNQLSHQKKKIKKVLQPFNPYRIATGSKYTLYTACTLYLMYILYDIYIHSINSHIRTPSRRLAGAVREPVSSFTRNSVQSLYFSLMAVKERKLEHQAMNPNLLKKKIKFQYT